MSDTDGIAKLGDNSVGDRDVFFSEVDDIGEKSAFGTTARTILAKCVLAAADKSLIKPHEANIIFHRYAGACKRAGGTPGSVDTNVSKIRKLIELGNQNHGLAVAEDAMRLHPDVKNAKSLFEGLVQVARLYLKEKRRLTDDEITAVLSKAPPKAKDTGWQSVAKHVGELVAVKDEHGIFTARVIHARLGTYLAECGEEIHEAKASVICTASAMQQTNERPALPAPAPSFR